MEHFAVARAFRPWRCSGAQSPFVWALAAIVSLAMAGCDSGGSSGGAGDNTETRELSGRVADGYLVGAQICLDLNGNAICDADEPSTETTAGGQYTLADITTDQYNEGQLLVQVSSQTKDEDDNAFVSNPYKLSTPQGQESFVSPVTTLVARALESDPYLDKEEALNDTALVLGLEESDTLIEDFVAAGNAGDASAQTLHEIAQVLATTLGKTKKELETALTNSGSDPKAQAAAVEATLVAALNRNLTAVVAVADDEAGAQSHLDTAMDESATVNEVERMADQQASETVETNAVKALFEQGLRSFDQDVFLDDECEDASAVLCFGTGSFNTASDDTRMNRVFTTYDFDNTGTALTPVSGTEGFECECDDGGTVWVLDDDDQFHKVDYVGVWTGYRVNEDGTLSDDTLYLGSKPAEAEATWNYELLKPYAVAQVVSTDTVRLKTRDIEGETLTSVLRRMDADSADAIADFTTPLSSSLTFPAGSTSYWLTFPETDAEVSIEDDDAGKLRTVDATGACVVTAGECGKTFDSLNDVFALPAGEAMSGYGQYLGQEYSFQIQFSASDSGQNSGTATLTRWYYDETDTFVEDTDFEVELPWERTTWHGKESIVLDRLIAHRYGIQERALVDTGSGASEPVLWASVDSPSGSGSMLMLNETAMDALVTELKSVFSAQAATL